MHSLCTDLYQGLRSLVRNYGRSATLVLINNKHLPPSTVLALLSRSTRSIHDNFLYVKNLARKLHNSRIHTLLLKLDIKKTSDAPMFLFFESSSKRYYWGSHKTWERPMARGSSTPLLFVLAIDSLHHILRKATDQGCLQKIRGRILRSALLSMTLMPPYLLLQKKRTSTSLPTR